MNSKDFYDDRTRLTRGEFVSNVMKEAGCKSSHQKMLGITGCRKNFANDVQGNDLGLSSTCLLDVMMSNTENIRR